MRPFRRLAEALNAMRPGWREVHGEMGGSTAITLGCTACRFRTTVEVQTIGVKIDMNPLVPVSAEMTVNARSQSPESNISVTCGIGVNQKPCIDAEQSCPFGESIPNLVERLTLNPKVLEVSIDPPREQF